jgi:hypothetical protein
MSSMASIPSEEDDKLFLGTLYPAMLIDLGTLALSYYATEQLILFLFDHPISVSYQSVSLGVISLPTVPVHPFMKGPNR